MNKVFEKILKKIEEKRNKYQRLADNSNFDGWYAEDIEYSAKAEMCEELKEIVKDVAEEYNGGWIPCIGCKDCKNKECKHYGKV